MFPQKRSLPPCRIISINFLHALHHPSGGPMLIILAPSKKQTYPNCPNLVSTCPEFLQEAGQLNQILRAKTEKEIALLMKTSKILTENTLRDIRAFNGSEGRGFPAIFTFKGDAYDGIKAEDWNQEQMFYAQQHLRILSGLYGILRPLDLMQKHRLEMGLKLATHSGTQMYQFWGEKITDTINRQLDKGERCLINLSSTEYSRVIQKKKLDGRMIDIIFRQIKDGRARTIPIYAKRARGAMANFMVQEKIRDSEKLKNFSSEGYRFLPGESSEDSWVFSCTLNKK
ncbi:conserved hypothetical protein [Desulfotalea psychrophila LSv54]|nr:conserved hypothetical protein [Desulfotalea psychrophila LSv54]